MLPHDQRPDVIAKRESLRKNFADNRQTPPAWIGDALIVKCGHCLQHPGAQYTDGSGVCKSCGGAGYKVLATRNATRATT